MRLLFLQRLNLPVVGGSIMGTAEHRRNLTAEFTYIGATVARNCCESERDITLKKEKKNGPTHFVLV